jgi:N utilization substance protein B
MIALQVLYECDTTQHRAEEVLARQADERRLSEQVTAFASELVQGVLSHLPEIDQKLEQAASPEWSLQQMAKIDKNILRLAIFEILYNNTVPARGAINEAVVLAKTFGSENSARFVNGVLGAVMEPGQDSPGENARRGKKREHP